MSRMRKAIRSPLLVLAFTVAFAGTALGAHSSGFRPTPLARGTLNEPVHYNAGEVKFQTKDPVDFVHVTLTVDPLGTSRWHTHPGVVLITVKSGTLTRYYADCSFDVYSAGSSFTEGGDHAGLVRNESTTEPAVTYITYVVPAGTTALATDKPNPGCPQD